MSENHFFLSRHTSFSHATTMSNNDPEFPPSPKQCLFFPPHSAGCSTAGLADALDFTLCYLHALMGAQTNPELVRPAAIGLLDRFLKDKLVVHLVPVANPATAPASGPSNEYSHLLGKITALETSITALVKASTPSKKADSTPLPQKPIQTAATPVQIKPAGSAPPTYTKAASAPLHPSVVVSTVAFTWPDTGRPKVSDVCKLLNERLAQSDHSQAHVSAARWTARGNLVLWGGPNNTLAHLSSALGFISKVLFESFSASAFSAPDSPPQIRPNVRWSKLLINRVPTGKSPDHEAYTPEECHRTLLAENPSYASLSITQRCWIQAIQGLPQASEVEGERGTPNALEPGSHRGGNHGIGIPDQVLALFRVRPLVVNTGEPPFSLLQCAIMSDCYFP